MQHVNHSVKLVALLMLAINFSNINAMGKCPSEQEEIREPSTESIQGKEYTNRINGVYDKTITNQEVDRAKS